MQEHASHHKLLSFESEQLQSLFDAVRRRGYSLLGPTVRDSTVVIGPLSSISELPAGMVDEQEKAHYRLKSSEGREFFAHALGPHSWKQFLHVPTLTLWKAKRDPGGFVFDADQPLPNKYAFVGVRPCELNAILIQDLVLLQGERSDPTYGGRRDNTLIIAVNCGTAGGTCFCASMGTGPEAAAGFDIALTELIEKDRHYFVARAGSDLGTELLNGIPHRPSTDDEFAASERAVAHAAETMGRQVDTTGIRDLLVRNPGHPAWAAVAARCMTCGNCTMVCPTCFCTTTTDVTDLTGEQAEHCRMWDSCFTLEYSYIHGGAVRSSAKSRFRQWLTHKFATWFDQFGQSGCVGCGRCITWCPAGIEVTEELATLRSDTPPANRPPIVKETPRGNA